MVHLGPFSFRKSSVARGVVDSWNFESRESRLDDRSLSAKTTNNFIIFISREKNVVPLFCFPPPPGRFLQSSDRRGELSGVSQTGVTRDLGGVGFYLSGGKRPTVGGTI